ncbi:trypsin-like serine peptidase [Litoreibacter roseus]|uniref:Serine protease n=1 Tax=Litoreibacter roseus TaxID=2601869 RepID=A0A6N6JGS6_9RHOB|nr:trypsin-like serine protease [Litoreibacter roseus]GFE65426.1 serine protease [Litoreibacter roseus]
MLRTLLICLVALAAGPVVAKDTDEGPHQALDTKDLARGWLAVGRLEMGREGTCTGALIAPRLVLTAAHCVYDDDTNEQRKADTIVFKAGYRHGRSAAKRKGRRIVVHNDYQYASKNYLNRVATDVALIELDQPIGEAGVVPFQRHRKPVVNEKVMVVSYARGRQNAPALEDGCQMLDAYAGALIYDCDTDFGSSGAPIFVMTDAGPKIASIISGGTTYKGKDVSLGAPLDKSVDRLLNKLASSNPEAKLISVGEASGSTAKRVSISDQLKAEKKGSRLPQIKR